MKSYVIALGNFDGVHLGHQKVILKAKQIAEQQNLGLKVFTFSDHPRQSLGQSVALLTTTEQKLKRLKDLGVAEVVAEPFAKMRDLSPEMFIYYLIGHQNGVHFVCGEDFHFGKNGAGTVELLQQLCKQTGTDVTAVEFALDENGQKISSRLIRSYITDGAMEKATESLGAYYCLENHTVHGKGLAHTWGTPTVNQPLPDGLVCPRFGVYATLAELSGKFYKSVTNVGVRPTFSDGDTPNMETYILDNDIGEISEMRLHFVKFLRPEQQFSDEKSLQNQIVKDVEEAKKCVIISPACKGEAFA